MADQELRSWDLTGYNQAGRSVPPPPLPNETWPLMGGRGTAWVYYAQGQMGLTRPVILSDGFHGGETKLDEFWDGLENAGTEEEPYAFASDLRRRGYDLIILGYADCTASILDNAQAARECIMRAIATRLGSSPLAVGGFSMGGLITRYILAKMERERMDHQTAAYICYDSPHHGAWMPIAMQTLAHSLRDKNAEMSNLVNSAASRQLLWRHIENVTQEPREDPMRTEFLKALASVGGWPQIPRLLGVANGTGSGDNGIQSGEEALSCGLGLLYNTKLYMQASGTNKLVAQYGVSGAQKKYTSDLPEADKAQGGMLESFGLAADKLGALGQVTCKYRWSSFVPTGSAIAVEGLDPWTNLGASVVDRESRLDDFKCASKNEKHTLMTKELGTWILDRLPR